ncbi:MAG: hypothetical protein J4203_05125 [Candidatus Diapherotrites archaeon]|uniref:Uncharacterized protein n=1 Tax=Candidatus Iainarchaeum sp. TaxID=3101447 RepID=A0A8T4LB92_9ARCH|nr:hypothetical protein [Candidatus Diapherotrites archaeon]
MSRWPAHASMPAGWLRPARALAQAQQRPVAEFRGKAERGREVFVNGQRRRIAGLDLLRYELGCHRVEKALRRRVPEATRRSQPAYDAFLDAKVDGIPFRDVFLHIDWNQALLLRRAFALGSAELYGNPLGPKCRITVRRAKRKIDATLDFPDFLSGQSWERVGASLRDPERLARVRAVFEQLKGKTYSFSVRLGAERFAALAEAIRLADRLDRVVLRSFREADFQAVMAAGRA